LEGAGITGPQADEIMAGWDTQKVKACGCIHTLPVALPADVRIGVLQNDQSRTADRRRRNRI